MTKTELTTKLQSWTTLSKKRERIEKQPENEFQTLIDTYEKKAEPINTAADRQLEPLLDQLQNIEGEIRTAMLAGINLKIHKSNSA